MISAEESYAVLVNLTVCCLIILAGRHMHKK